MAMPVLARCPICRPLPDTSRCLPAHSGRASDQTKSPGDGEFVSHQRERVATSYSKASIRIQMTPSCNCIPYVLATFEMIKQEEADNIHRKLPDFCRRTMGCMSNHQKTTSVTFQKSLVVANALILTLPFEALAQTCEANNSFFNMPLPFAIALIGATVGGLLARQRKGELKRLNDQLRQINSELRRQAKLESYAPKLSYVPIGRVPEAELIVDPRKEQLISSLRAGKNFLRNQDPEKAFVEFKTALDLAQSVGDHIEEKKAARGIGASLQRQGKYREAIKYHSKVLEIAKQSGEDSGCTEAYGAIADCYTDLGDLEQAGKFYDEHIARLTSD